MINFHRLKFKKLYKYPNDETHKLCLKCYNSFIYAIRKSQGKSQPQLEKQNPLVQFANLVIDLSSLHIVQFCIKRGFLKKRHSVLKKT